MEERTIPTPAAHWAHHALTHAHGIGHCKGNFGNFLFLWDVLLGTAHITRRDPARGGLQDHVTFGRERWFHPMFYPVLQSRREHSAVRLGGKADAAEQTLPDVPASQVPKADIA